MSVQSMIRVLVVDDFADWRRYLLDRLGEDRRVHIVGVASDGLDAVLKAEELQPDVIVLDIGLPQLDGIRAARQISWVAPESRIIFLSQEDDFDMMRAALSAGGFAFVAKSDADCELLLAVEAVTLGKTFVGRRLAAHALNHVEDLQTAGQFPREERFASRESLRRLTRS
jgi:DNA-binding NarL/FixJ family response regulator